MKTAAAFVLACSLSRLASADDAIVLHRTCVEIDAETDGLAQPDREHALALVQRVLEREDLLVVTTGCTETYVLSHQREGDRYVIRLRNSAGKRRMTTPELVELSDKYTRMARSLIEAKAVKLQPPPPLVPEPTAAEPAVARPTAAPLPTAYASDTSDTPEPTEARKPSLWYSLLGFQVSGGVAVTAGYRRHYDSVTLDIALGIRGSDTGSRGTSLGGKLLGNKRVSEKTSLYAGGGLSVGTMETGDGEAYSATHQYYWGGGMGADFAAGVQSGGPRGTQFLAQFELKLPFYEVGNNNGETTYVAAAMLSAGLGW
jgi:hypothetical protein